MTIIRERERKVERRQTHSFLWRDRLSGFVFEVDDNDECVGDNETARENFRLCKSGEMKIKGDYLSDCGVSVEEHTYTEDAVGLCKCGEEVVITNEYYGAFQCPECGQWYNLAGQELMPPEFWED